MPDETPTRRLIRACLNLRAELEIGDIEGGLNTLNTLPDFDAALAAMPETADVRAEAAQQFAEILARLT